jgi:hypothetical protein
MPTDDPVAHPHDVGVFITQPELAQWWAEMQKKYPASFLKADKCPLQHPYDQKLISFYDNDPTKPIRVEIVGSKFRVEEGTGKFAFYVIRYKDIGEIDFIHLTVCHEEDWKLGW